MPPPEIFAGVLRRGPVAAQVDDRAWLQAMLDAEAALARAQATVGMIPESHAREIAACCQAERFDAVQVGEMAAQSGNPAAPLARLLCGLLPEEIAASVHRGATSQDIVDTAAMLVTVRSLDVLSGDLERAADAASVLARDHAETAIAGRTLLQQAVPTTFGLKAATWMAALDESRLVLDRFRSQRAAAQLGGAAGTLSALGDRALEILAAFAAELGLAEPVLPWHTDRTRIGELGGALALACGAVAKIGGDVVLLSQTEVGEVRESSVQGGSSAMPHKRNPVAAISAIACARQAPGQAAILLAAMEHEHERAAGAWHAEWAPLSDLLASTGSAVAWIGDCLAHLQVDAARMTANLGLTGGALMAEGVVSALARTVDPPGARRLVDELVVTAIDQGKGLADVLVADPRVNGVLGAERIADLCDPARHTGHAAALVARALAVRPRPGAER